MHLVDRFVLEYPRDQVARAVATFVASTDALGMRFVGPSTLLRDPVLISSVGPDVQYLPAARCADVEFVRRPFLEGQHLSRFALRSTRAGEEVTVVAHHLIADSAALRAIRLGVLETLIGRSNDVNSPSYAAWLLKYGARAQTISVEALTANSRESNADDVPAVGAPTRLVEFVDPGLTTASVLTWSRRWSAPPLVLFLASTVLALKNRGYTGAEIVFPVDLRAQEQEHRLVGMAVALGRIVIEFDGSTGVKTLIPEVRAATLSALECALSYGLMATSGSSGTAQKGRAIVTANLGFFGNGAELMRRDLFLDAPLFPARDVRRVGPGSWDAQLHWQIADDHAVVRVSSDNVMNAIGGRSTELLRDAKSSWERLILD